MLKLTNAGLMKLIRICASAPRSAILNFAHDSPRSILDNDDLYGLLEDSPLPMPEEKTRVKPPGITHGQDDLLQALVRKNFEDINLSEDEMTDIVQAARIALRSGRNINDIINDFRNDMLEPFLDIDMKSLSESIPEDATGTKVFISNWPGEKRVSVFDNIPLSKRLAHLHITFAALPMINPGIAMLAIVDDNDQMLLKISSSALSTIEVEMEFPLDDLVTPEFKSKSLSRLVNEAGPMLGISRSDFVFKTIEPQFEADKKAILHIIRIPDSVKVKIKDPSFGWFKVSPDQIMKSKKTTLKNPNILKHIYLSNLFEGKQNSSDIVDIPLHKTKGLPPPIKLDPDLKKTQDLLFAANNPDKIQLSLTEVTRLYAHNTRAGKITYGDHAVGRASEAGIGPQFLATIVANVKPQSFRLNDRGVQMWLATWRSNLPLPPGVQSIFKMATYNIVFNIINGETINIATVVPKSGIGLNSEELALEERLKWKSHHERISGEISSSLVKPETLARGAVLNPSEYADKNKKHIEKVKMKTQDKDNRGAAMIPLSKRLANMIWGFVANDK